jgi:hypothetical protein
MAVNTGRSHAKRAIGKQAIGRRVNDAKESITVPPPLEEEARKSKPTTSNTKGQQHQGDRNFHCGLMYKNPTPILHRP